MVRWSCLHKIYGGGPDVYYGTYIASRLLVTTTHFTAAATATATATATTAVAVSAAVAEKFKCPYDCRVRRPSRVRVMLRLVTVVIVDYKKRPKTIDDLARDSSKVFRKSIFLSKITMNLYPLLNAILDRSLS